MFSAHEALFHAICPCSTRENTRDKAAESPFEVFGKTDDAEGHPRLADEKHLEDVHYLSLTEGHRALLESTEKACAGNRKLEEEDKEYKNVSAVCGHH